MRALEHDRTLFEFNALIRPMEDLALYRADMDAVARRSRGRGTGSTPTSRSAATCSTDSRDAGPLSSRDDPRHERVPWPSSGWTNDRNVTQMLEFLAMRGEVAIAGRRKRERVWDLAERVYPADLAHACRPTRQTRSATNDGCDRSASPARSHRRSR